MNENQFYKQTFFYTVVKQLPKPVLPNIPTNHPYNITVYYIQINNTLIPVSIYFQYVRTLQAKVIIDTEEYQDFCYAINKDQEESTPFVIHRLYLHKSDCRLITRPEISLLNTQEITMHLQWLNLYYNPGKLVRIEE